MIKINPIVESFLHNNGFSLTESSDNGRLQIYFTDKVKVKIVNDYNGFEYFEIGSPNFNDRWDWLDLAYVRSIVLNNEDYMKALDTKDAADFIVNHYRDIVNFVDKVSFVSNKSKVEQLQKHKTNIKYGPR